MEQQQLRGYVEQLNRYLNDIEASEQEKRALQSLITEIQSQLSDDDTSAQVETLSDQVDELASVFETEHPVVSAVLKNVMVTLTSMGV